MKKRKPDYFWRLNLFMMYADSHGLKLIAPTFEADDEDRSWAR